MGLYDYIKCEYPIDSQIQNKTFQTKSLYCHLEHYKIDKEGRWWKLDFDDDDEYSSRDWVPIYSSEHIRFYTSTGKRENGTYQWHEYQAYFKKGELVDIERIESKQEDFSI